jgi:hypothetical protein
LILSSHDTIWTKSGYGARANLSAADNTLPEHVGILTKLSVLVLVMREVDSRSAAVVFQSILPHAPYSSRLSGLATMWGIYTFAL